jgi:flagellin
MKICYNSSAMIANNALTRNDNRLAASLQRLSSGLKVVEAKDNPAGMAMGKRMNAQLRGISVASQNSSDAISVIETADGALSEVHDILQRMNQLAVKASTGTLGEVDRATIQDEIDQLKQEITRIAEDTQFNGEPLLNGNYDLKGYTDNAAVKVGYYSDEVTTGVYTVNNLSVTFDADGNIDPGTNFANILFTGETVVATPPTGDATVAFPADARVTDVRGNIVTITSDVNSDFEMNFKITGTPGSTVTVTDMDVEITGIGAMTMQIGSNEGQTLDIRVPTISLSEMGLEDTDMSTAEGGMQAIEDVKYAIQYVSKARSRLGAYQNRLEHSISNLDITDENMTAAYSRIMDVDMAEEMTEYTTVQVISQASMSMLAQANERPAQVLQLLQ